MQYMQPPTQPLMHHVNTEPVVEVRLAKEQKHYTMGMDNAEVHELPPVTGLWW